MGLAPGASKSPGASPFFWRVSLDTGKVVPYLGPMTSTARTARTLSDQCTWPSGIHATTAGRCTRCGATEAPAADAETFEHILGLEAEVKLTRAMVAFAPTMTSDRAHAAKVANAEAAQAALFAAVDELTPEQAQGFAAYRATRGN